MGKFYAYFMVTACLITAGIFTATAGNIIINNQLGINQTKVETDVAFNGWIFAAHSTVDSVNNEGGITIRRSKDGGITWETIDYYSVSGVRYPVFDIAVMGTDTNNLLLSLIGVNYNVGSNTSIMFLDNYNATTATYLTSPISHNVGNRAIHDVAIATDYKFPAVGASPFSVAYAYTCSGTTKDSVNYACSIDGGQTYLPSVNVATTTNYYRKLSMAYGSSASASNGRYFLAWEQLSSLSNRTGSIFTSRNQSAVNGAFISPLNLDSVSSSMIGLCRNPRIAVSQSLDDNDSASVTAVVLVDRDYNGDGSDYDLLGFYNKRAHFTNFWNRLDIVNTGEQDMQGDICFDPNGKKFMATYLDSTNHRLPYITNDWNLTDPNIWVPVLPNYDDVGNVLGNAFPRVSVNPLDTQATFAWIRNDTITGNGVAYFDAEGGVTVRTTISASNCTLAPYNFNGQMLSASGAYTDTLIAASGADSIITLNFTQTPVPNDTFSAATCSGTPYIFNGQSLLTAGYYADTLTTGGGCDSISTLVLTINALPNPTITQTGNVLTTETYVNYLWQINGGNISGATAQSYTAIASGIYSVLVTDTNGCTATSAPLNVTVTGINSINQIGLNVYPNPATEILNISMPNTDNAYLQIVDVNGRVISAKTINTREAVNVGQYASGTYYLLINQNGKTSSIQFIKQ